MKRLLAKSASAGSGKTTALVFRYVSLLLGGAKPDEIVALTFTVKAANNMKERIFAALDGIESYPFLDAICLECAMTREDVIRRAKAVSAALSPSSMRIATIDSFFSSILGKFCFYAGVPYGYETLEETDIARLRLEFIGSLSEAQIEKVAGFLDEHDKGLGYFLELFDFLENKNANAKELFCADETSGVDFEIEFAALVSDIAKYAVVDRQKKLFVYANIEELASKTWLNNKRLDDHSFLAKLEFGIDAVDSFGRIKSLLKEYFADKQARLAKTINALFEKYESVKNRSFIKKGKLSFSDISLIVFRLLRGEGALDTDFLYFRLDGKINHILIDEFQDTSLLQYEILFPLIEEIAAGVGQSDFGSFFFVGDTKQSIYRFRGGNSELFGEVAHALEPYGLEVERLDTNYRSDRAIVEFANSSFEGVMDGYVPQKYSDKAKEGFVEVIEVDGTNVAEAADEDDENSHHPLCLETVRIIEELVAAGANPSDIAVLTATNADSVAVVDAIREVAKLEALQDVSQKVVDSRDPKAIISYIKYLFFGEKIYRELFLSNISASLFGEIPTTSIERKPCELVAIVMRRFGILSDEALKLVNIASKFESVYDFVHEIDTDKTKLPEGKSDGVKVLTVHKSKGLEFAYTICMDRTAARGANDDGLLFEYDGTSLERAFFRWKNRENFDDEYAHAEKAAQATDRLNMLYVAFTRAEHALFVVKKQAKTLKSGETKYDGVFSLDSVAPMKLGALNIIQKPSKPSSRDGGVLFRIVDHGRQEVEKQKNDAQSSPELIYQGLALHLLMENIDLTRNEETFERALNIAQNRYGALVSDMQTVAQMGKKALSDDAFVAILDGAKLFKECSFCASGKVGRLDLLAIKGDEAIIIDYKSSSIVKKEHNSQVSYYKKAVGAIMSQKPTAYILLLGHAPSLQEV
jgi:exodeoxyribonuclease V beta subunit